VTIFLLEYDPAGGVLLSLDSYSQALRAEAHAERLRREKENARNRRDHEVVLLEAVSEAALRSTHARYFKTLSELARDLGAA
jgi:hypothetical protein